MASRCESVSGRAHQYLLGLPSKMRRARCRSAYRPSAAQPVSSPSHSRASISKFAAAKGQRSSSHLGRNHKQVILPWLAMISSARSGFGRGPPPFHGDPISQILLLVTLAALGGNRLIAIGSEERFGHRLFHPVDSKLSNRCSFCYDAKPRVAGRGIQAFVAVRVVIGAVLLKIARNEGASRSRLASLKFLL
jgi:hypothetical protein